METLLFFYNSTNYNDNLAFTGSYSGYLNNSSI